jgi:hypothetical protein
MKKILALVIAVTFLLASVSAFAGTENDAAITGDIIFARPLGLVGIVAGAGFFVLSLPFAYRQCRQDHRNTDHEPL